MGKAMGLGLASDAVGAADGKGRRAPAPIMQDGVLAKAEKLEWLPFEVLPRPKYLDGALIGDRGFDPLNYVTKYQDGVRVKSKITVKAEEDEKLDETYKRLVKSERALADRVWKG